MTALYETSGSANIESESELVSYSPSGDTSIRSRIVLDDIVGGGAYTVRLGLTSGSYSAELPVLPSTTFVTSGSDAGFVALTETIDLKDSETLHIYATGLSGDTEITYFFDVFPATASSFGMDTAFEGAYTFGQYLRATFALLVNEVTRSGDLVTWRDIADTKDRVTIQVNSEGERLSVTLEDLD